MLMSIAVVNYHKLSGLKEFCELEVCNQHHWALLFLEPLGQHVLLIAQLLVVLAFLRLQLPYLNLCLCLHIVFSYRVNLPLPLSLKISFDY